MENVPLYRQVYDQLRQRILSGVYRRGTALPSEPRLCDEFGVSRITIRRAMHELALDGLVEQRQGLGSFVRSTPQNVEISLSSFTSDVAAGNLRLVRTLLADETIPASDQVAAKLGVQHGSMVRHLMRLDDEGGTPLSVDEVFIPPAFAAAITSEIAASPLFLHLWQIASRIRLTHTFYDITVRAPNETERELLRITSEMPLLVTGETLLDAKNRPVGWILTRYRGDRCHLAGTVRLVQRATRQGTVGE